MAAVTAALWLKKNTPIISIRIERNIMVPALGRMRCAYRLKMNEKMPEQSVSRPMSQAGELRGERCDMRGVEGCGCLDEEWLVELKISLGLSWIECLPIVVGDSKTQTIGVALALIFKGGRCEGAVM